MDSENISESDVRQLAFVAGLALSNDRVSAITPVLNRLLSIFRKLDELDLGEVQMDLAFRVEGEDVELQTAL